MADKIGPTFGEELAAAGLGNGISWDPASGVIIAGDSPAVEAVLAAHDPTKQLPITVTRKQARLALVGANLLSEVEQGLTSAGGADLVWYQDSDTWTETDPHVQAIGQMFNLSSDQIHALFVTAQGL